MYTTHGIHSTANHAFWRLEKKCNIFALSIEEELDFICDSVLFPVSICSLAYIYSVDLQVCASILCSNIHMYHSQII